MSEENNEALKNGDSATNSNESPSQANSQKLYADKYKSVEDLEKGYLDFGRKHREVTEELDRLKKVPEAYEKPKDIQLSEHDENTLNQLAKEGGLTQDQYSRLAHKISAVAEKRKAEKESAALKQRERLGIEADAKLSDVKAYLHDHYPQHIADQLSEEITMNPESFDYFSEKRNQSISVSHNGSVAAPKDNLVKKSELNEAFNAYDQDQGNDEKRDKYFSLSKKYAEQQK